MVWGGGGFPNLDSPSSIRPFWDIGPCRDFSPFLEGSFRCVLLFALYCAIPRDYLSDTPLLRAVGLLVSQHGQLGVIPPPPFLSGSPLGGAIPPHKRRISAILERYHMKTRQMGAIPPSAILSRKGIARHGGGYLALGR